MKKKWTGEMCDLVMSLENSTYWKKNWRLGNTEKKTPREICQMVQEGMTPVAWFKTFSYDRVMLKMPNGNLLVLRDRDGKIKLRHTKKRAKRIKKVKK